MRRRRRGVGRCHKLSFTFLISSNSMLKERMEENDAYAEKGGSADEKKEWLITSFFLLFFFFFKFNFSCMYFSAVDDLLLHFESPCLRLLLSPAIVSDSSACHPCSYRVSPRKVDPARPNHTYAVRTARRRREGGASSLLEQNHPGVEMILVHWLKRLSILKVFSS